MKICKVKPTRKECRKCCRKYDGIYNIPPCEMCGMKWYEVLDYCVNSRGKGYVVVERDGKAKTVSMENIYDLKKVSRKEYEELKLRICEE